MAAPEASGNVEIVGGKHPAGHHSPLFRYVSHPHIFNRKAQGPVRVADQMDRSSPLARFNARLALLITVAVGSMWCAYLFTVLAFVSFPQAIKSGNSIIIVAWIAQTFLQLVLLPIIIVGQNVQASASDKRAEQTYNDAEAVLHEAIQIEQHLCVQDAHLSDQEKQLEAIIAAMIKVYPGVGEELQRAAAVKTAPIDPEQAGR